MTHNGIRRIVNWVVPPVGLGLMVYYNVCDTACSSLQGTFLGLDLKWVGIAFMAALLALNVLEIRHPAAPVQGMRTVMLAGALGGETLLVHFQIVHDTYCPFCLAFVLCILILFAANVRRRYGYAALLAFLAGVAAFALFFQGSVLPLYR
jgi:uncharacterized membrane protein